MLIVLPNAVYVWMDTIVCSQHPSAVVQIVYQLVSTAPMEPLVLVARTISYTTVQIKLVGVQVDYF